MTSESPVPAPVRSLIDGPIRTMEHVEAVLLLRGAEPEPRSAEVVAAGAHIATVAGARRCLDELVAGGLAAAVGKGEGGEYRYAPRDTAARGAVDALADMYNTRPVTLVRALYSRPAPPAPSPVRAFADAFRLRRDDEPKGDA